jgi:hypothetical protein
MELFMPVGGEFYSDEERTEQARDLIRHGLAVGQLSGSLARGLRGEPHNWLATRQHESMAQRGFEIIMRGIELMPSKSWLDIHGKPHERQAVKASALVLPNQRHGFNYIFPREAIEEVAAVPLPSDGQALVLTVRPWELRTITVNGSLIGDAMTGSEAALPSAVITFTLANIAGTEVRTAEAVRSSLEAHSTAEGGLPLEA